MTVRAHHYQGIEERVKERDQWIAEFKEKEQDEKRKKQEQAIQEKLAMLSKQDGLSEESESDQEQEERAIQEKVDGLYQYQINIAFHHTKLGAF